MAFPKEKLNEELKKQVEALLPDMKKLNFRGDGTGPYWDQFSHSLSGVTVKIIPFKEPNRYGSYGGFKLRVERNYHPGRGSNTVLLKIDNLAAVKKAITDSISYRRSVKKSERTKANFKVTLEKTLPRLFPGHDASVYTGSHGDMHISMISHPTKPSVSINISPSGQISKVEISYPKAGLEDVAKLLEAW